MNGCNSKASHCITLSLSLPGNAGCTTDMIIEGTIVDSVATALIELSNIHSVTAVVLEGGNVFILLHHTTWGTTRKMFNKVSSACIHADGPL